MVSSFSSKTANVDCNGLVNPGWALEMLNNHLLYFTSVVFLPPSG